MREGVSSEAEPREYRCPGETYSISRTVHLGRMASFYAACRDCPHSHDTGTLPPSIVRRLNATRREAAPAISFGGDDRARVRLDDSAAARTRSLAAAHGVFLQQARYDRSRPLLAVLASDGRAATSEAFFAASEGLRWAGCEVIDLGAAAAPALAQTIAHLQADGGLLLGVEGGAAAEVTISFWGADGAPCSTGEALDSIRAIFTERLDRPTRAFGGLRRFDARALYLEGVCAHFHALRPLRFVLDTTCQPLVTALAGLTQHVACEVISLGLDAPSGPVGTTAASSIFDPSLQPRGKRRSPALPRSLAQPEVKLDDHARRAATLEHRVRTERAHFGLAVDASGESCRLVDELGRSVDGGVWLAALARHVMSVRPGIPVSVALEEESSSMVSKALAASGVRAIVGPGGRQAMHALIREHDVLLAGGPSGRIWQRRSGVAADALAALGLWLTALSQTDRAVSQVLSDALAIDSMPR